MNHRKISETASVLSAAHKAAGASPKSTPHPADKHVGRQIAAVRARLAVSQPRLAAKVGISYQQLQKYESGKNRVSASTLYEIATALEVPVGRFFAGLPGNFTALIDSHPLPDDDHVPFIASAEGRRLIEGFMRMRLEVRARMSSLITSIGERTLTGEERRG